MILSKFASLLAFAWGVAVHEPLLTTPPVPETKSAPLQKDPARLNPPSTNAFSEVKKLDLKLASVNP